ncbi:hypothetical protein [Burkholderia sp. ABCPW 14]|uniref:hypothetical protein n=1 Tax=Burkholderia sp. ABCPW 14 TaxID=1637860 RepID=UPI000AAF4866|nr:hypothetical protein [Burkholderia sp. ABCPW 14]
MKESEKQRSIRREMSKWLTETINNVKNPDGDAKDPKEKIATPAIRAKVLTALQDINERIKQLNKSLSEKYHIIEKRKLVKFYMKGGNAFYCVSVPGGSAATQFGGGTSDWDTQIIVDPWAPVPLQAIIYGELEELVTDAMIKAGVEIASVVGDFDKVTATRWTGQSSAPDGINKNYKLEYDKPQSLRKVFDQQRLGLWTNDQRRIAAPEGTDPNGIPGILLNDAIRPFVLYRLGYTWHAAGVSPDVEQIRKPLLMELIDVTLPRRDTIEAVAVWEELDEAQGQERIKIENQTVTVEHSNGDSAAAKSPTSSTTVELPLPDIMYHLREIATMLCEIADRSSHHADKLERRFQRFGQIWQLSDTEQQKKIIHTLSTMAGVSYDEMAKVNDVNALPLKHNDNVTKDIESNIKNDELKRVILGDKDSAYRLARNLMDRIADGIARQNNYFFINKDGNSEVSTKLEIRFQEARHELKRWIDQAKAQLSDSVAAGVLDGAFSDDLVLILLLQQEKYLAPQEIGFSDVFQASVIRVATELHVYLLGDSLLKLFDRLSASIEDPSRKFSVLSREYNVPRATGNTNELTMVVFRGGKAIAYVSVSNAPASEAPFRQDVRFPDMNLASLPEIAAQRKVAAALIEDYLVRKAISRQYEALKTLLPVI